MLVDRYGPRRILVVAAGLMGSAQLVFALVPSYPAGLAARALLGCGDALTFVSVLRFAATHFAPRRFPLIVAMTSMVGMVGNVLATLPLVINSPVATAGCGSGRVDHLGREPAGRPCDQIAACSRAAWS